MDERARVAWQLILRTIGLVILIAVVGWVVLRLTDLVLLILLATVISSGLIQIVDRVQAAPLPPNGWRLPPAVTVLLVYIVLIGALLVGGWRLARPAVGQLDDLAARLPSYLHDLDQQLAQLTGESGWFGEIERGPGAVQSIRDQLGANAGRILGVASGIFGVVTSALFTLVLALYMTVDHARIREGILAYLPADQRPRWRAIMMEAGRRSAGWLIGQVVLSLVIFAITAVGLVFLGVPYALALAVVAGLLEVLPILGPLIAGALATLVAVTVDWGLALRVVLLYIVVQQLENHLLVPRIIGEASGLHPLVVIIALLIGSGLFGILGAVLAVPVATAVHVALSHLRADARAATDRPKPGT